MPAPRTASDAGSLESEPSLSLSLRGAAGRLLDITGSAGGWRAPPEAGSLLSLSLSLGSQAGGAGKGRLRPSQAPWRARLLSLSLCGGRELDITGRGVCAMQR